MFRVFVFFSYGFYLVTCYNIIPIPMPDNNFLAGISWDAQSQSVLFTDFISPGPIRSIYRYDYLTGKIYSANIEGLSTFSFFIAVDGYKDKYVVGVDIGVVVIQWDGVSTSATVLRQLYTNSYGQMNYAVVDPQGRLFAGTVNGSAYCSVDPVNPLYRYSHDQGNIVLVNQIKSSSGLAINPKACKFYHIDACLYQIVEFDYDQKTGDICNGRVVYDFRNSGEDPLPLVLGMTIDVDENLWVTLFQSYSLWKIDPRTSTVLEKITLPSKGLSGVAFGGPHMDKLFIISSRYIPNVYDGTLLENRTQDATFFMIEGLGTHGYKSPGVIL